MQKINVWNTDEETAATNLKNALMQYASDYFTYYDTDFTNSDGTKVIQFKMGDTVCIRFVYKNGAGYFKILAEGITISATTASYEYMINSISVYDNAILFGARNTYDSTEDSRPILLCKTSNGAAIVLATNQNGNTLHGPSNNSINYFCVLSVDRTTGTVNRSILPLYCSGNSSGTVEGFSLFSLNDGRVVSDAYVIFNSDFRSHSTPLSYVVGGQTYTGFAGNYIAIKGT